MPPLLRSMLFDRRRQISGGRRKRGSSSAVRRPGFEALEPRAMLAAGGVLVGFGGNRVTLSLDSAGGAITNLATAYDAPAARLTITAATAGALSMSAPVNGISVDDVADTITVDLKKITNFAGLSIVGGRGTDSVRIGPGGVNLAAVSRGAAAQSFTIETGPGAGDAIVVGGQVTAKRLCWFSRVA